MPDHIEVAPATQSELSRFVAENASSKQSSLIISGGRTALHLHRDESDLLLNLSTLHLTEVIDYPARDMTITIEAGLRVELLQNLLAQEGQQLPIDIPQANHATIGGAVATNCSGPRRFGYGTIRDYLIGISAVDFAGNLFSAGGRVVKNVAGYDLCKLLTGSWGTLAIITQLTFKLKPIPEQFTFLWVNHPDWDAVEASLTFMNETKTLPVIIEVLNQPAAITLAAEARLNVPTKQPVVTIGIEGSQVEVDWQIEQLIQEFASENITDFTVLPESESEQLLNAMTDFSVYADTPLTFYASLPPSKIVEFVALCEKEDVAILSHAGNGILLGVFPDSIIIPTQAEGLLCSLREFTLQSKGTFTVRESEPDWKQKLSLTTTTLNNNWNQQIKQHLDPLNLLNPGHRF